MADLNSLANALQKAVDDKNRRKLDEDRKYLVSKIGPDVVDSLKPFLKEIANNSKLNSKQIENAIVSGLNSVELKIEKPDAPIVNVASPEVIVPPIKIPEINVPVIKIPDIKMPNEMDIKGWVSIMGYDRGLLSDPLPVQLRDSSGKPVNLFEGLSISTGGGGGKADYFTIAGFGQSAYADLTNADGRLRVSVETGGSGLTDAELRASSVPVEQVSGSIWSTYITGSYSSVLANDLVSPDNRLKVELPTGASGLTDTELRASSVPVEQVSGSIWSVNVAGSLASVGATILNGEGLARDSWVISDVTASVKAALIDSSGVQYSGSNPVPATLIGTPKIDLDKIAGASVAVSGGTEATSLRVTIANDSTGLLSVDDNGGSLTVDGTVTVSSVTSSVAAALVGSSGVQYSGSNPLPTYLVGASNSSTYAVGPTVADGVDDGSAPIQLGGIARTANPGAVSGGDVVKASFDDVGRQLTRPVQARDLIKTAYVTEDEIQEVTLLAGVASTYHDLIYIMCANESTAAINLDIRQTTGGTVQMSIEVPANGTAGVSLPVPIPQDHADATWTVKNSASDNSNTVYSVTALFSKEI